MNGQCNVPAGFKCPLLDLSPEGFVQTLGRLDESVRVLASGQRDMKDMLAADRKAVADEAAHTRAVAYEARGLSWKAVLIAGGAIAVACAGIAWLVLHLSKG